VQAGEGFSPGKAPSRTLPKSAYGEGSFVQEETAGLRWSLFVCRLWLHMRSSFASFLLTQKKRRPPAGLLLRGRVVAALTGRDCRFAVVSFCLPTWLHMRSSFASFLLTQKKRRPPAGLAAGAWSGGFDRKGLPVCGGIFLFADLAAYAVFFCFFSSGTEEKKAPGMACCGSLENNYSIFPGMFSTGLCQNWLIMYLSMIWKVMQPPSSVSM